MKNKSIIYDKIKGRILRNAESLNLMYGDSNFNQEEFEKAIGPYLNNKEYYNKDEIYITSNELRKKYLSAAALQEYYGIKFTWYQRLKFKIFSLINNRR